jgi:class 3 adenylate cyclase/tetratricopeptide (TPR) repeat protein
VQCLACGAVSEAGKRFCADCGAPLASGCPSCGAAFEPGKRFCGDCGAALAAESAPPAAQVPAASAPVSERRVCTVLFCDLVGFTPLSEARDPEEVRELLSRYFDIARTIVGRYGGTVEKFIGDAVMAVWGTPTAAEGDAERAVRAGLDLTEAVAELGRTIGVRDLAARAGIVTGEVAVTIGAVGEGMVAGDSVNTAARVQATAQPGQVLIDDTTWRVVRDAIACAAVGEFTLKGKADPVSLWQAQRVVSAVGGGQRIDGLEAPLVGRDAELRLIKELFHACADRRSARLVSVVGPAGVGKSRIGWEFFKYTDGLASVVWWHRGRCLSYGDGVAFFALAEMVRQRLGIAEEDPSEAAADKLRAGLEVLIPDTAIRDYIRPRLAQLLGVDSGLASALPREELFAGWRSFFQQLATALPVVLVIEDLHYADPGLLDFVEHLLDWARDDPIFVLTLARPEIEERRPGWGAGRRNATSLAIDALDDDAMHEMLDGLVSGMPEQARTAVAEQAQGNPLYAVETVRMLIDRDVVQPIDGIYRLTGEIGELTVPESLQSLLAARLDALPERARRLVSDAAVLGTSFPLEALTAVSDLPDNEVGAVVNELVRREVLAVRADPLSPERGQYTFVQTMFRQVAYDTLPRRERKVRHITVADHLAMAFADGGEEVSEVIAQHLVDALGAVPDADDVPVLRQRAVDMLVRAARRAARTGAPRAGALAYVRAAELLMSGAEEDRRQAAGLFESAAKMSIDAGDPQGLLAEATRAVELFRELGLSRDAARATCLLARALRVLGRMDESIALLEPALAELEATPGPETVQGLVGMGMSIIGRFGRSRPDGAEYIERAFALAQELGLGLDAYPELFVQRGVAKTSVDCWVEGAADYRESLRLAVELEQVDIAGRARLNLADALMTLGDYAGAQEAGRDSVATFRRSGSSMYGFALGNLLQAMLLAGEWPAAAELVEESLRDQVASSHLYFAWIAVVFLALRGDMDHVPALLDAVDAGAGDSEDRQDRASVETAHAWAALAKGDAASAGQRGRAALGYGSGIGFAGETSRWAWPVSAEAALARGDLEEVDRLLEMITARPPGQVSGVGRGESMRIRARLLAARGDPGAAEQFDAATAALRQLASPWHLALGLTDEAEFAAAEGDAGLAGVLAEEARQIAERLGARPLLTRLDNIAALRPTISL